ncbi:7TM chemoreceptor [Oesophagostomum dentatum]|uniref:7TM chemoreceptor n=1 Tax=Oesophagostomum dentatum TaxID=61180 RepID=A0A0B1T989_OESDE|nr:7TM chemoreceptor [Oesophagostomum dentatum]
MSGYDLAIPNISYYYLIFMTVSVSANALLIFLIQYRSPHVARGFKILLVNTAANQFLVAVIQSSLQERVLTSGTVLALLPAGPLRYLGPTVCYVAYNVINALNLNVGISVFHSMYFRYRLIKATELSSRELTPYTSPFHFDVVMEAAIRTHPEYNLRKYGPFGGFKSTNDPLFIINTMILCIGSFVLPAVIFYWKRLILKSLNSSGATLTEKTRHNSRTLLKALSAQAVTPLLCVMPGVLLYVLSQFSGNSIPAGEYLMPIFVSLPCAIDPLLTIYFITPYRNWVIQRLRS